MTKVDWYRQTDWTDEIAAEFEQRLSRSRGQRSEYLRIQALTLVEQNKLSLAPAAIGLAKRQLELSGEGISAAQVWATIAKAYAKLGQRDDAVEAYRQSIRREAERPNVRGYHYIDFAWYAATSSAVELYQEVIAAIENNFRAQDLVFPATQFRYFGALALIADDSGNRGEAKRMAQNAIDASRAERGPFWRHQLLGLFAGRKDDVHTRLERLAETP